MTIEINIEKGAVIDELHRQTALLALKNEYNETLSYNSDDNERIEPLWVSSLDELLQLLIPFAKMSVTDDGAVYLLTLPSNWDDFQSDTLQQLSHSYVTTSLTARWLDTVKPDSAMLLRSLNNSNRVAITEILYKRKKPEAFNLWQALR